jgi:hypothetical protein
MSQEDIKNATDEELHDEFERIDIDHLIKHEMESIATKYNLNLNSMDSDEFTKFEESLREVFLHLNPDEVMGGG